MAGYLIAEEGPLAGLTVRLEEGDQWSLGRDPDEVSVVLEDPMVSRKHAVCRLTAEGYILDNLSSVNPVTQNGKVLTEPVLLREGDILQIGSTFFRFSEKSPEMTSPVLLEEGGDLSSVQLGTEETVRWFLKVVSGPNSGAEFTMHPHSTYVLGKDPHLCDIVFQDLSVSRQHAKLRVDGDNRVFIEDLESRNGVLVNGERLSTSRQVASQDLISLGTTAFLLIDREEVHETIFAAPAPPASEKEEAVALSNLAKAPPPPADWRETLIPKRHLVLTGVASVVLLLGIVSAFALFHAEPIVVQSVDESGLIKEALHGFSDVQFSYNAANGKILLVGHVLTSVDRQELLYKVNNLPFIQSIDDTVVIDEYVWENMNALLVTNPNWVGVSIYAPSPGKFVLRGYLTSLEQLQALSDYLNINFPYLDRLDNQVVIETNLETQIQSILIGKGFSSVTFQLSNGEVVLAGRVEQSKATPFAETVEMLKSLRGIRIVKNFVILTTSDTSRIDISSQYTVSGYSKKDEQNFFVVINGKILSLGESIDGMKITGILPNMVLLEKDGLKFRINYNLQ